MWEIFARLMPYFYMPASNSNQIMFGVSTGRIRPKRLSTWPRLLECLFERCIDADDKKRPSMRAILEIMHKLNTLVNGDAEIEPLVTPKVEEEEEEEEAEEEVKKTPEAQHQTAGGGGGNVFFRNQPERYSFDTFGLNNKNNNNSTKPMMPSQLTGGDIIGNAKVSQHRRSKSHGNDMIISSSINKNVVEQWKAAIASTMLNPVEPLYGEERSMFLFNLHKKLIKEDDKLSKECARMKQQRDQLEATVKIVNNYGELMKQRSLLIEENERLRRVLTKK
jgi:hypothetical protein